MFTTTDASFKLIDERGPRWAVVGTIRPREVQFFYADTAERAEAIREDLKSSHHRQVQVHPPQGSVNLAELGGARLRAKAAFDEATSVLRAGVLRAAEEGRSEVEIAKTAGVDRMTVRKWLGK